MAIPKIPPYSYDQVSHTPNNRAHWQVEASRAVLLVHDMQNYFLDFYDRTQSPITELVPNIRRLREACKRAGIPTVYTAQPGDQAPSERALLTDFWGPGLGNDPQAQAIDSTLAPAPEDHQFTKWRYSAFQRTPLHQFMRDDGRDQLIVCGVYAHIGILATSLEAFMTDIQAFVVADAVADFSAADHRMALDYIAERCGCVTLLDGALAAVNATQELASSEPLSLAAMKRHIADSLSVSLDDIGNDDNLMYLGLDSIRLMTLLEKWREMGADVSFAELAETASVGDWWALIAPRLADTEQTTAVRRRA